MATAAPAEDAPISDTSGQRTEPQGLNIPLIIGVMLASLLQILDTTIANVAIPHMQAALGATNDTITWVLTSYIIAAAVAMPATGWLADRIGARRLFLTAVAGFIITSMLCGLAQNLIEMVAFRLMQGLSGAFIAPLGQAALLDASPRSKHPQMMAIYAMGVLLGPILGPIVGGWLTENYSWRWVFFVNVPSGLIALFILMTQLPRRPVVRRRFDLTGFALIAIMLCSVQLMLDRGNQADWFNSAEIWLYLGLAVSCGWMTVIHFTTARDTLFDKAILADRNFLAALMIFIMLGFIIYSIMALMPPMLEHLFGFGVIDAGLTLAPRGVGAVFVMNLSSHLIRRGFDARILIGLGFLIADLTIWQMTGWNLEVAQSEMIIVGIVQGLGLGLIIVPLNIVAFQTLPQKYRTDASSLLNLARSLAASLGIAMVSTLLARNTQISHADLGDHIVDSALPAGLARLEPVAGQALAIVDAEVNRQAAMIAYLDDFYLIAWMILLFLPIVFVMKKSGPKQD
ncbi:MAG TPA: MDR family MFS transporter [Novosphingobium sp.]|nr:MDR family MFS transporter [Novosphingobium sp.]